MMAQEKFFSHERSNLENNYKILETLQTKCIKEQQKVTSNLSEVMKQSRKLDRDMNALKNEIIVLFKQRHQMAKQLHERDKTCDQTNQLLAKLSAEEDMCVVNKDHRPSSSIFADF